MPSFQFQTICPLPRVVGTASDLSALAALSPESACDLVELRLDLLESPEGGLKLGETLLRRGMPALATLRLAIEGGKWSRPDRERIPILKKALENLAGADIELQSEICAEIAASARALGKECIVSHHDFQKTPPRAELEQIIRRARDHASTVKISTMVNSTEDVSTLRSLLECRREIPLCVIGMGPLGSVTRREFPLAGSALTYGYLDHSVAPGQLSATELTHYLEEHLPGYRERVRPAVVR